MTLKGTKLIRLPAWVLTKKQKGKFQVVQLKVLKIHYWPMGTTLLETVNLRQSRSGDTEWRGETKGSHRKEDDTATIS